MKLNAHFALGGVVLLAGTANAQLKITEVMSNADAVNDYFEITNLGGSSVDISGWKYDDISADINEAVLLEGVTEILAGQSVVFIERNDADAADVEAEFRAAFGGLAGVVLGFHNGAGLGGTDTVNIFDALDNLVLTQGYTGGHAGEWAGGTNQDSAIWVPGTVDDWTYAQSGLYGSIMTPDGDWGNPGVVPEPATMVLLGLGAAAVAARKKRKA